jgi:dTDP-4-dehydrorhamnose reductase
MTATEIREIVSRYDEAANILERVSERKIESAVLAERERCAKIAEDASLSTFSLELVAARIRSGK